MQVRVLRVSNRTQAPCCYFARRDASAHFQGIGFRYRRGPASSRPRNRSPHVELAHAVGSCEWRRPTRTEPAAREPSAQRTGLPRHRMTGPTVPCRRCLDAHHTQCEPTSEVQPPADPRRGCAARYTETLSPRPAHTFFVQCYPGLPPGSCSRHAYASRIWRVCASAAFRERL
eukprot:scaffold11162_cov113-Isochrysis_galbana.AAC.2